MARVIRYTIAGMLGALIAWVLMEWTPLMPDDGRSPSAAGNFVIGLLSGLFVGVMLGLGEAVSKLSPKEARHCILSGALVGAAGGILGLSFGNAIYSVALSLAGGPGIYDVLRHEVPGEISKELTNTPTPSIITFLLLLIGRGSGWALLGGSIGLSQGIATGNTKKMVNGFVGGLIGGGLGGSLFEILVWISLSGAVFFAPWMIRFLAFGITGGSIGLFIGFIEEVTKRAWIIRLVGRNEGKEYVIFKPVTVIGRSEVADVPVFGDPDISERHATISTLSGRHVIEDMGSFSGTQVNNQKVSKQPLRDGDTIVIGKTRFMFRDKATARSGGNVAAPTYDPGPSIPTSQHVCQFCGSVKDADGKCECSVGATPTPIAPTQPTVQQTPFAPPQPPAEPTIPQGIPAVQGARLVAVSGPFSGQTYLLRNGALTIGRDANCDVPLGSDNTVSRGHARIAEEVTEYVLYDMGSTNGTFVNGKKIMQHNLAGGDIVQIGNTKFRFGH